MVPQEVLSNAATASACTVFIRFSFRLRTLAAGV